ncbi:MAG: hypothetical protein AB7V56_13815 [Candidatus Nitrosocosmicus sp.]
MKYSQTLEGNRNISPGIDLGTTSLSRVYQGELIDFVYKEVIEALKKRRKGDSPKFDLDSFEVLINAQKKAHATLRGGSI